MTQPTTPQPGLGTILGALATGGQPIGQLGQGGFGIDPSKVPIPQQKPQVNPARQAQSLGVDGSFDQVLQGLLGQGVFNGR